MIRFLARRLAYMAVTVLLVSFVSFVIVQAAPGDYAAIYAAKKALIASILGSVVRGFVIGFSLAPRCDCAG